MCQFTHRSAPFSVPSARHSSSSRNFSASAASASLDSLSLEKQKLARSADMSVFHFKFPAEPRVLKATMRTQGSKVDLQQLRDNKHVPCIVLSPTHPQEKYLVSLDLRDLAREMRTQSFTNTVFIMEIEGRSQPMAVIPRTWLKDGKTNDPLDVQFFIFDPARTYKVNIPVHFEGEEDCVGVKKGGTIVQPQPHLQCLYNPTADANGAHLIPHSLIIDVTGKAIGDNVREKMVPLPPALELRYPGREYVVMTLIKQRGGH